MYYQPSAWIRLFACFGILMTVVAHILVTWWVSTSCVFFGFIISLCYNVFKEWMWTYEAFLWGLHPETKRIIEKQHQKVFLDPEDIILGKVSVDSIDVRKLSATSKEKNTLCVSFVNSIVIPFIPDKRVVLEAVDNCGIVYIRAKDAVWSPAVVIDEIDITAALEEARHIGSEVEVCPLNPIKMSFFRLRLL